MNLRPVSLEMSFFQSHSVIGAQAREDTGEGFYEINRIGEAPGSCYKQRTSYTDMS